MATKGRRKYAEGYVDKSGRKPLVFRIAPGLKRRIERAASRAGLTQQAFIYSAVSEERGMGMRRETHRERTIRHRRRLAAIISAVKLLGRAESALGKALRLSRTRLKVRARIKR